MKKSKPKSGLYSSCQSCQSAMPRCPRQLLLISQNTYLFCQLLRPILFVIRLLPLRKYFYPPLPAVIPLARYRVPAFSLVFPIRLISNINEKTAL
jgi:hypothetical protein